MKIEILLSVKIEEWTSFSSLTTRRISKEIGDFPMASQHPSSNTPVNDAEVVENLVDKAGVSNLHVILMEEVLLLDMPEDL